MTTNSSTLSWPYSSIGQNISSHAGLNNKSHTSTATWVYLPGQIPTPALYLFLSWFLSFGCALLGVMSSSDHEDRPWTSYFRIPGISFSMFRCIAAVVKATQIKRTQLVPSGFPNTAIAMSLMASFTTWEQELDYWSLATAIGATTFWVLTTFQFIYSYVAVYGHGKMMIDGGTCPRELIGYELCNALEFIGCSEAPQEPVLVGTSIFVAEVIIAIPMIMRWESQRTLSPFLKYTAAFVLGWLLFMFFYTLLNGEMYVDSKGVGMVSSNTTNTSEKLWPDCFTATEPRGDYGFFKQWATDIWNESKASALSIIAVI
ncbi:hypothetical protein VE04_02370 [Pseudogymnoascus sp. 24MN13]|nr:hypothetical protein VE04_02370 [Pseudogymnoascus sp. 24MN13]